MKKVYLFVKDPGIEVVDHIEEAEEIWVCTETEAPEREQLNESCRKQRPIVYRDFRGRFCIQNPSQKQATQSPFELEMEVDG